MPDAIVSYELSGINNPPSHNTLGDGGSIGSLENFSNTVPTTWYAVKVAPETHAGTVPYFAASIFGSCSCPSNGGGGAGNVMY